MGEAELFDRSQRRSSKFHVPVRHQEFFSGQKVEQKFDGPLVTSLNSGLPRYLYSVEHSLAVFSSIRKLPSSVEWRLALTVLKLANAGACNDIDAVRRVLGNALHCEGWMET